MLIIKNGNNSLKDYNIVVNYSLDNHIALYGRYYDKSFNSGVTKRTVTKSGYLINLNNTKVEIDDISKFYVRGSYDTGGSGISNPNRDFQIGYNNLTDKDWITLIECSDANLVKDSSGYRVVRNLDETYMGYDNYNQGYIMDGGAKYIDRKSVV